MKKLVMLLLVAAGFTSYAQKPAVVADNEPGWTHIGQVTASFKTTDESIVVLGADEFQAIKLKVNDAPLHIERIQVFYESGQMEELDVKAELREGAETRVINLSNPTRDIKKVAFTYRTLPNAKGDKADVELYGLKTGAQGDAYIKDDVKDAKREAREEAREVKQEAREEAREMKDEAREESNEARRDIDRAEDEVEREADEAGDEVAEESREGESEVRNAARNTGNAISEAAREVEAAITDKKLKDKVGPGGENVYVDENEKYYYINNEGEKIFITKMQLKDKPNND